MYILENTFPSNAIWMCDILLMIFERLRCSHKPIGWECIYATDFVPVVKTDTATIIILHKAQVQQYVFISRVCGLQGDTK